MNKQKIAVIGTGGCGNKLLNTLLEIDPRYLGVFVNTNIHEMKNLNKFNPSNSLYFSSGQGTGRNREVAEKLIKQDQAQIIDFFSNKFSVDTGVDTFFILTSSDGGTGSGSAFLISTVIKKAVNRNATVNLLVAMGDLKGNIASLNNTKSFWQDLIKALQGGLIDSVQFIDNNKMIDETEFNKAVMKEFDDSISINSNSIDEEDSKKVNTTKGYKVTLKLDSKIKDVGQAIMKAKQESNFIIPENIINCQVSMVSVNPKDYNKDDFKDIFTTRLLDKYDYNSKNKNMIVLGGVSLSKSYITLVNKELKEKEELSKKEVMFFDDLLDIDDNDEVLVENLDENSNEVVVETVKEEESEMISGDSELMDLMKSDNFWD